MHTKVRCPNDRPRSPGIVAPHPTIVSGVQAQRIGNKHRLRSSIERIEYEHHREVGFLHQSPLNNCDMGGCINLFQDISPRVRKIITWSGDVRDTGYQRINGKWTSDRKSRTCNADFLFD